LQKTRFLDILAFLRLHVGQISFNLEETAFATRQLAVIATSITLYDILAWACAEIKILKEEKVTNILRLFDFCFFAFPFSPFLFFSLR